MNLAIIGAMEKEIELLKKNLNMQLCDSDIYYTEIQDKKIYLCLSGIGKVNASIKTQYLIDKYSIDYIINTGCAGSLDKSNNIMDIIIPNYVTYHDFYPERIMKLSTPNNGCLLTDEYLNTLIINVLLETKQNYKIAPICSGDRFVTDNQKEEIKKRTDCSVVDMESASIAHTCAVNKVPVAIIRTISDFADGNDVFENKASYNSALIVQKVLEKLGEL